MHKNIPSKKWEKLYKTDIELKTKQDNYTKLPNLIEKSRKRRF